MPKARRISEVAAQRIAWWRNQRNLTVEQLVQRVAALGEDLPRVTITKIENGQRGISLDEGFLLAAALNVPPPLLFLPLESGEHVAVTPKSIIHPDLAYRWLTGEGPLASTMRGTMGLHEWLEASRTPRLYEQLHEAHDRAERAHGKLVEAVYIDDDDAIRRARKNLVAPLRAYAAVLEEMRTEGLNPPALPTEWDKELRGMEGR